MTKRLDGINIACQIAKKRKGKCLSIKYTNNRTHLIWECKDGHNWKAVLDSVKCQNTWCPKCAIVEGHNKQRPDGIKIASEIAKSKGGSCLSKEYKNAHEYLKFKCSMGHKWKATLDGIKNQDNWCQICGYSDAARKMANAQIINHWKTNEGLVCVGSYEKAVIEYLNKNKINFKWQHKTFYLPDGRTYRPDMYLFSNKKWIEIKGYFRDDAEEKWNWFHKEHKNSELWNTNKLKEMRII